jgi:hypothetical protein
MAAKVAVLASPNFVVAVRLAVARLPPGADVVSMIAYVLLSARGKGDDDGGGRVGENDDVAEVVGVKDGVPVRVRVNDGVFVGVFVPDREDVRDSESGGRVPDCVIVLLTDAPEDGVALALGENSGAPRIYTPRP